ncbi:MAG: serine hydrolase [Bacillota bacterium]
MFLSRIRGGRRGAAVLLALALCLSLLSTGALADDTLQTPGPSIEDELINPPKPSSISPHANPPEWAEAWNRANNPPVTLSYGTPEKAGMMPEYIDQMDAAVQSGITAGRFPGAVVIVVKDGMVVKHQAYGYALQYKNLTEKLPQDQWLAMRPDTIFDMASVSKLFTSTAAMQLVERGLINLDDPVANYIPAFAANGKEAVTIRQLLTHTSGFPAWLPLYSSYPTPEARVQAVYDAALVNPPGSTYLYSDLNMITMGRVVESVSGLPLDQFVARNITEPLGMKDTGYNPPASELQRIAATEYQPWTGRGIVWGTVHDENAYSLNGVAGHAGVFSTAYDLAILAQTFLNGGRYGQARILQPETVREMLTNMIPQFPGDDHGLGWELNQMWYEESLASGVTAGHTGYTGTSIVVNPLNNTTVILLTNRVHPSRNKGSINAWRQSVADLAARAIPVRPATSQSAWYSGLGNRLNNTLTLPVTLGPDGRLSFRTWYHTEDGWDWGYVEVSTDNGLTWSRPSGTLTRAGREEGNGGALTGTTGGLWVNAEYDLSAFEGQALLRFRYRTDSSYHGRGWYVDNVEIKDAQGVSFKDGGQPDVSGWVANGWTLSGN